MTDNAYRIDGMIVNDYANAGPGSTLNVNLGVDAIREFSVLTNNYSAEYGRGSGGIINAITKSGTNQIHGSAFEFVRNSAFDARNFFDGNTIPPFRRNQYGGSVGGPIKKNRTFYFTNYERLGQLRSLTSSVSTLSANVHNGILCANSACTQTTQVAIKPVVKPYLALFPFPNGLVSGNTGLFNFPNVSPGHEDYVIGKIDHYFTSKTTLAGSYTYDNTTTSSADPFDLKLGFAPSRKQNIVLSLQHIFSATVINSTRFGVSRTYAAGNLDGSPMNPAIADPSLGFLPGIPMGTLSISGVSGSYSGIGSGLGSAAPTIFGYTTPQLSDDLSWAKGRHNIRVGFSFERIDYNTYDPNKPNGAWTFSSIPNFLAGIPSQFTTDFPGTNSVRGERMSIVGGYIQDDFRMSSNLTINLGMRYEMGTVITEVHNLLANLRNLTDPAVTVGNPYYNNPTLKDFAPRIGFAWDPFKDGKTAIRGGFGMFDMVPLPYLFLSRIPRSVPYYESGVLSSPLPSSFPNNVLGSINQSSAIASYVQFNPHRSYKAQWNLNIQRQLTKSMALTAGYVGSAGVHLAHIYQDMDQVPPSLVSFNSALDALVFPIPAAGQQIQRINPNFGQIEGTDWTGHSSYHALQANLVQRLAKGLTYQIAYTWSKSIDDGTTTFSEGSESANAVGAPYAFARTNRGVSDFNIPQNFVANFQYELPVPGIVKAHALANTLFGGWQLGGIFTRQSGAPFSLKIGSDVAQTGSSIATTSNGGERPMYFNAPGCSPDAITGNINQYIMTQCFAFPAPGVLGNLGRNTLHMPTFRDLDFSVFKNGDVWGEKIKYQFRVEMFNILNNTNLQAQTLTIFDGKGNLVTSTGTPTAPTVNTSRQIQFGLRLIF